MYALLFNYLPQILLKHFQRKYFLGYQVKTFTYRFPH